MVGMGMYRSDIELIVGIAMFFLKKIFTKNDLFSGQARKELSFCSRLPYYERKLIQMQK